MKPGKGGPRANRWAEDVSYTVWLRNMRCPSDLACMQLFESGLIKGLGLVLKLLLLPVQFLGRALLRFKDLVP